MDDGNGVDGRVGNREGRTGRNGPDITCLERGQGTRGRTKMLCISSSHARILSNTNWYKVSHFSILEIMGGVGVDHVY